MKTIANFSIFIVLIFVCYSGYSQNVGLRLNQLWCDKTTESGEDEIYFLVSYRYSNGTYGQSRVPGPSHFNLNDGNQPRQINNITLWSGMLPMNTYCDISIFVMEEDNGGGSQLLNDMSNAMSLIGPGTCAVAPEFCPYAKALIGLVNVTNKVVGALNNGSDDYIGSYSIRISNDYGYLNTYAFNPDRIFSFRQFLNDQNLKTLQEVKLSGDGSSYTMYTQAFFF